MMNLSIALPWDTSRKPACSTELMIPGIIVVTQFQDRIFDCPAQSGANLAQVNLSSSRYILYEAEKLIAVRWQQCPHLAQL